MTRPAEVAYKSWPGTRDQTGYAPPAFEICHTPLPAILPLANGLTKTCTVPEAPDVYANQRPSSEILPRQFLRMRSARARMHQLWDGLDPWCRWSGFADPLRALRKGRTVRRAKRSPRAPQDEY